MDIAHRRPPNATEKYMTASGETHEQECALVGSPRVHIYEPILPKSAVAQRTFLKAINSRGVRLPDRVMLRRNLGCKKRPGCEIRAFGNPRCVGSKPSDKSLTILL